MKKYEDNNSKESNRFLVIAAFVCMGLCFLMLIIMLASDPLVQPTKVIEYNYSQIDEQNDASKAPISNTASIVSAQASQADKININNATKEELMTLKDIGEKRAADIIAYREQHGAFESIEQIMRVDGIGSKTFKNIKDRITV